jgi:hypothetical protein
MFIYARYHRITALVAPSAEGEPLDAIHARRLVRRLRVLYPLAGLEIWEQPDLNPREMTTWEALREIIVNAISRPPDERPSEPPLLSERQAVAYLGVKLDRLRLEVNIGELGCSGTRRHRRFATSELDRWRDQRRAGARATE